MTEDNHGHSTAAWVGVAIMLVGSVISCWGVFAGPNVLLWVGLGVAVVGALAWYGLELAGKGSQATVAQKH